MPGVQGLGETSGSNRCKHSPKWQKTVHSYPALPSSVSLFIVLKVLNVLTLSSNKGLSSTCCVCTMSPLPLHTQHPFQLFSLYTCLDHSSLKPLPLKWLCFSVTNSPFSSPLPTVLKHTSSLYRIISSLCLLHLLDECAVSTLLWSYLKAFHDWLFCPLRNTHYSVLAVLPLSLLMVSKSKSTQMLPDLCLSGAPGLH